MRARSLVMLLLEIFLIIALTPYIVLVLDSYSDQPCVSPGYSCEADGS